jgi:hypothetical protein
MNEDECGEALAVSISLSERTLYCGPLRIYFDMSQHPVLRVCNIEQTCIHNDIQFLLCSVMRSFT